MEGDSWEVVSVRACGVQRLSGLWLARACLDRHRSNRTSSRHPFREALYVVFLDKFVNLKELSRECKT